MHRLSLLALPIAALVLSGCNRTEGAPQAQNGDPKRGAQLIASNGCGTCHTIPGIERADGKVGPTLSGIGSRTIIAGVLSNNPPNMIRWLEDPQSIVPGNAMPEMEITDHDAQDIAAYLYSLR